jgi:ATP-dependent Clp protease ATP-binding subunit ClpC
MFERFTNRARQVVVQAQEESRALHHEYIGTEHILLALMHEGRGQAARILAAMGIPEDRVRSEMDLAVGQASTAPSGHIPFTPRAKKTLELSLREAMQLGDQHIGTEHILLGLIREGDGRAAHALQELGVDLNSAREHVIRLHQDVPPDAADLPGAPGRPDEPLRAETESMRAGVEALREEIGRLRALLRRHNIDPDEDSGPLSSPGSTP